MSEGSVWRKPPANEPEWLPGASAPMDPCRIVGVSDAIKKLRTYIRSVAASDCNVLITGETGTGKELVARMIHTLSPRSRQRIVAINCAAIPNSLLESEFFGYERGAFTGAVAQHPGKLEQAAGGTVFLDEIGEMSPYAQAKILRVLEAREIHRLGSRSGIPFEARIVAATNRDPKELADSGLFRFDLYYRLNVARIHLTPLRDRKEDIPVLLAQFMREMNGKLGLAADGFSDEAKALLLRHDWRGNVRELRNLVEAVYLSRPDGTVGIEDIPDHFRSELEAERNQDPVEAERDQLLAALEATNWNKSQVARRLRWSRMKVYRKLAKLKLIRAG